MKKNRFLLLILAIVAFGPTAWAQDLIINSVSDWDNFASAVSNGNTYANKTVKLNADITATNMVGTNDNRFKGTFDGDGHTLTFNKTITTTNNENSNDQYTAPFRYIEGATIQNLKVAGEVSSKNKFAGGIVGHARNTGNTITNCVNSTVITAPSASGNNGSHGGILGQLGGSNSSVTISGCVFNGKMMGSTVEYWCGIMGYTGSGNYSRVTISNCFFNPEEIEVKATDNNHTICRPGPTINNCYYNAEAAEMHDKQGKQAYTISSNAVSLAFAGNPSSNTTLGVIGYGTGIKYNNVLYAGDVDNVSLNITAPEGYAINTVSYTYEGGSETTINPVDGVYSFTMPDANVTINATLWNVYTKDITAYTSAENGWYLIASPIGGVNATAVTNLANIDDNDGFDLYRFNQAVDLEWENWKDDEHSNYHFNLEPGRGYLYANSEDVTLTFIGTPYDGDGSVSLACTNDNPHENMRGWNLIGNPFGETAYIYHDFYRMNYGEGNTGGYEIIPATNTSSPIAPMEGIFVYAEEEGLSVTFSTQAPSKGHIQKPESEQVVLNLSRNRGSVIDRAIVRMGEGQALPKFQIRENSTKLYIPQGAKDYAIATSNGQGEMLVNFHANENGEYTLTVNPENVEMNYLHLIDNLTGADVDLLQTPEYTFTAKTTDYESRFKLVFNPNTEDGPSTGSGTFAFIDANGNIIITADVFDASLQVIDVQGRVIRTVGLSQCGSRISTAGMTLGVYMLRLINGDDVRTQKMVIK